MRIIYTQKIPFESQLIEQTSNERDSDTVRTYIINDIILPNGQLLKHASLLQIIIIFIMYICSSYLYPLSIITIITVK